MCVRVIRSVCPLCDRRKFGIIVQTERAAFRWAFSRRYHLLILLWFYTNPFTFRLSRLRLYHIILSGYNDKDVYRHDRYSMDTWYIFAFRYSPDRGYSTCVNSIYFRTAFGRTQIANFQKKKKKNFQYPGTCYRSECEYISLTIVYVTLPWDTFTNEFMIWHNDLFNKIDNCRHFSFSITLLYRTRYLGDKIYYNKYNCVHFM